MVILQDAVFQLDFTGVNNRERMLETVGMAGAAREDAPLDWITEKSTFDIPEADYCILVLVVLQRNQAKDGLQNASFHWLI